VPNTTRRLVDGKSIRVEAPGVSPSLVASEVMLRHALGRSRIQFSLDAAHKGFAQDVATNPEITRNLRVLNEFGYRDGILWAGTGDLLVEQPGIEYWEDDGTGRARRQHCGSFSVLLS